MALKLFELKAAQASDYDQFGVSTAIMVMPLAQARARHFSTLGMTIADLLRSSEFSRLVGSLKGVN